MAMLNCDNVDPLRQDSIIDDVRELSHGTGPNLAVQNCPAIRSRLNVIESFEQGSQKFFTETGMFFFVPFVGGIDFIDRFSANVDWKRHRGRLTCSMSFSSVTAACGLASRSLRRRSNSVFCSSVNSGSQPESMSRSQ